MRKNALAVAVLFATALAICSDPPIRAEEAIVVTLGGDPWPPYMLGELGQEATGGIGVELMRAIFDRIDRAELKIPLVPWKRALREVESGSMDGIGILLKTPEREEYMEYTDELFRSHNKIWYPKTAYPNGFEWSRLEDLKGYTLGGVRGHSYGELADAMIEEGALNVIFVSSTEHLFSMLSKGRIDLALANSAVGSTWARRQAEPGKEIAPSRHTMSEEVFYIAFSKTTEARVLIPAINQIISEMREEGLIESTLGYSE